MQSPKTKQQLHPVLTVSQLTAQIKDVVEQLFTNVYVVGEVSNAKAYPSGHWYFSLKDKDATISCVCFRSANANIKFKLEDGLMLVAQGNLSVYPPKGGYQLVATALEPVGIGEWQLAFEQLRAALEKEGLLDPARKKPIPTIPRRVGVVTSPAAAALRDILSALSRRNKNVNVVISPTRVQGEGSAEEIAQAIRDLQQVPGIDVIIVARGGGSIEDLWSFNTDVVARAVAACPIPIVSGVGHETDITICDLVADLRAPTPTAAAELVAKGSQELFEKYKNLEQKLVFKVEQRLSKARRQVDRLSPINALTRYQGRLKQHQMRVGHYKLSIERSVVHMVKTFQHRWQQKHDKLLALAPTNVLNRGFAMLRKLDGTVVCDPGSVVPGEELQAILKTGSLLIQVCAVQSSETAVADPRYIEEVFTQILTVEEECKIEGLLAPEKAPLVFDPELADAAVLAKIFGEELADIDTASAIFKSSAVNSRLELEALDAELTKDLVPPLVRFEPEVAVASSELSAVVNLQQTDLLAPTATSSPDLAERGDDKSDNHVLERFVVSEMVEVFEVSKPAKELAVSASAAMGSPSRHREAERKAKLKTTSAAHQLNLFKGADID